MKALTKYSHGVDKHCRCCGAGHRRLWKKAERRAVRRTQRSREAAGMEREQ